MRPKTRPADPLVSIVTPVLDEAGCVEELAQRVREAANTAGVRYEILFVDDGSSDGTPDRVEALRVADPAVKLIRFTRSFGHQAALAAGLRHARGDAVVTMDGDLQHPPELIPELLDAWRRGSDVVYAARDGDGRNVWDWKDRFARLFYRVMGFLVANPPVPNAADFRLMDRRVVEVFNALDERFLFIRGLIPWLGFPSSQLGYREDVRLAGLPKYSAVQTTLLALDGVFSFSVLPLRLISGLGLVSVIFGLCYAIVGLAAFFLGRVENAGWTSLFVLILFFGGVQLVSLGIVSEYVGRIYEECKHRPRYVIDSTSGIEDS